MSRLLGGEISELVLILLNLDFEIDRSWTNLERFLNNIYIPTKAKYYPHSNSWLCWALLRDAAIDVLKIFCELKISTCIPLRWNMRPPPIYPQLPHLHDHGLAILTCITPFCNMCPPSIFTLNQCIPFHLKRSFCRSDFSPLISARPPSPQETEHEKKKEKEKKKESSKSLFK
jgi:hypothetical protein